MKVMHGNLGKNGTSVDPLITNFSHEDKGIYTCTIGSALAKIDLDLSKRGE